MWIVVVEVDGKQRRFGVGGIIPAIARRNEYRLKGYKSTSQTLAAFARYF